MLFGIILVVVAFVSLKFTVVPSIINVAVLLPVIDGLVTVPNFVISLYTVVATLLGKCYWVVIVLDSPSIKVVPCEQHCCF